MFPVDNMNNQQKMNNRNGGSTFYTGSFLSNIEAACDAANKECRKVPRTDEELVEFRRAANRRSAKQSRDRKKAETDKLARKAEVLLQENTQLKRENAELRNQVDLLMKALHERTQTATANYMNNTNHAAPTTTSAAASNITADISASNTDVIVTDKNDVLNNDDPPVVEVPAPVMEAPTSSSEVVVHNVSPPIISTTRHSVSFDADDSSILKILMDEKEEEQDKQGDEITDDEAQQQIEPEPLYNVVSNKKMNEAQPQIEPEPLCNVVTNKSMNSQLLSQLPFDFESIWQQQIMNNKADLFCGNTGPTQAAAMINAASYNNARSNGAKSFKSGAYGKPNKKRARAA